MIFEFFLVSLCVVHGAQAKQLETPPALRVMLDRGPATLNPRRSTDAPGQRLGALIFRALTRMDAHLSAQPDLASDWEIIDGGKTWKFKIRPGQLDQSGQPITATAMAQCLEQYRQGKPVSILKASFPDWLGTEAQADSILFRLSKSSPYLAANVSLLRYFRIQGKDTPCTDPNPGDVVVASGPFKPRVWQPGAAGTSEDEIWLDPVPFIKVPGLDVHSARPLHFLYVQDDNTRLLKLLRNEVDVTQTALSLAKQRWLLNHYPDRYDLIERTGVPVSYLAMNLRDPILGRREVRQAIALAIDRESIVRYTLHNFCALAGSFLAPSLPESFQSQFEYDPARSEQLLDQAGLRRAGPGQPRFKLKYRSTPVREGIETALIFQNMLKKIGIELTIDAVEPAVFFASIRKGQFQLYSSRWIGVSDGSILFRTLRSGQLDNRVGYKDAVMDALLDQAVGEIDVKRRTELIQQAQRKMAEDLPYFPLWYWKTSLVVRHGFGGLKGDELSMSGAYEPILKLQATP